MCCTVGSSKESRPNRPLVCRHFYRVLVAATRLVLLVPFRPGPVQHVLARVQDRRVLSVLHQFVYQSAGTLLPQPSVSSVLHPLPVLLLSTRSLDDDDDLLWTTARRVGHFRDDYDRTGWAADHVAARPGWGQPTPTKTSSVPAAAASVTAATAASSPTARLDVVFRWAA